MSGSAGHPELHLELAINSVNALVELLGRNTATQVESDMAFVALRLLLLVADEAFPGHPPFDISS